VKACPSSIPAMSNPTLTVLLASLPSYFCIFQNVIPLACWPTSTLAAFVNDVRSKMSTLPGCAPFPSTLTNA
jgi:hypothetical protein